MRTVGSLSSRLVCVALASVVILVPVRVDGQDAAHVAPVQDLAFGQLFPGIATRVGTGDVSRRGEVQLEGRGQYHIQFLLPEAMTSAGGTSLPLRFGAGDAALVRGSAGTPRTFDPTVGTTVSFSGGVLDAQVFLGGTADPDPDQTAGVYSATITILLARN